MARPARGALPARPGAGHHQAAEMMSERVVKVGEHSQPIIYWQVIEMYHFQTGEIYGKTLFKGTERECESFANQRLQEHRKNGSIKAVQLPGCFESLQLAFWDLNVIATTREPNIYKVVNTGRPGLQ